MFLPSQHPRRSGTEIDSSLLRRHVGLGPLPAAVEPKTTRPALFTMCLKRLQSARQPLPKTTEDVSLAWRTVSWKLD